MNFIILYRLLFSLNIYISEKFLFIIVADCFKYIIISTGADEDLANELTLQFSRRNVRDKRPSGEDEESKLLE